MNVGISDIYHKCDKTNIWTEKANDRLKTVWWQDRLSLIDSSLA